MKNTKAKRKLKDQKAITLIALVITIIVLLILAAVTIATLTGDNGILTQANNAKTKNKIESDIEAIRLAMTVDGIAWYSGNYPEDEDPFLEELKKTDENAEVDYDSNRNGILVHYNGSDYIIDSNTKEIEYIKKIDFDSIKFIYLSGDYGISEEGLLYNIRENICLNDEEGEALYGTVVKEVASGYTFCAVLDENGKVWTWNTIEDNSNGELGNGTTSASFEPTCISDIAGNPLNTVTITTISSYETSTIAVDSNGKVWGWGNNSNGQLGDGTRNNTNIPKCISDLSDSKLKNISIRQVSLGNKHGMALDSSGKVWTWGNEENGVLGNGSNVDGTLQAPLCISDISGNPANGVTMKDIAAGEKSSATLDINGNVWTWGLYTRLSYSSDEEIRNIPENKENVSNNIIIKEIFANKRDTLLLADTDNKLNTMIITDMRYDFFYLTINNESYRITGVRQINTCNIDKVILVGDSYIVIDNKLYEIEWDCGY